MKKLLFVLVLVFLFALPAYAQEPTEEPTEEAPVVEEGGVVVIQPEQGTITVVNPPATVEEETDWLKLVAVITLISGFVGALLPRFFKPETVTQARGVIERAEGVAWVISSTFSDAVEAFGGRRDVVVSTDPYTLAKALKDKDVNVLIHKDADIQAVVDEYNKLNSL